MYRHFKNLSSCNKLPNQDIRKWNYDEIPSLKYKSIVNISNNKDSIKFFKIFKSEI